MARRDTLDLEVLGGVACQLKHFGCKVFENGGEVDGGFGANARLLARDGAKVALYATARKLWRKDHVSTSFLWQLSRPDARGGVTMGRDLDIPADQLWPSVTLVS
jgi:hypothetical protein